MAWTLGLAAQLALFSGCQTAEPRASALAANGGGGAPAVAAKDKVLWQYRQAVTALRRGQTEEAKAHLDDVLLTLGGLAVGDKNARRARGYFHEESRKTFRGEPYERVMAYYYRGLIYWMEGELDNARACYRSAQLEDSDAENRAYAADYLLLDYLDGLATHKLGGDGSDALARAQARVKDRTLPPYEKNRNVLFFLEFGRGPTKFATGDYQQQLRFRTYQSVARSVQIRVGDQVHRVEAVDDLNFQATTRGGRIMDHVLANKAVFKSATDTFGNAALISGAVVAQNRQTQEAGLALVAAGLISKLVSAAATPAADTRAWDNLPQYLSFAALALPPGQHLASVEFLDAQGLVIPKLSKSVTMTVASPPRDTVVFVSDQSLTSTTP
jgi:hypothetical protein